MQSITDIDLGTPKRSSDKQVTLEVDGVTVSVPEGSSVMYAASIAGTPGSQAVRHRYA